MDQQQEVDDDEQVVRVPERVEPGEVPSQREGEQPAAAAAAGLLLPLPERARGEGEGDGHERHHHDPRHALGAGEEAAVGGLVPAEEARHQAVLVGLRRDEPREVARQVVPRVQADAHRDRRRDDLPYLVRSSEWLALWHDYDIRRTLWKAMLSSKGTKKRAQVERSHVSVLRHTGSSTSAMLSLSVSAAPLAVGRQYPITRNAADRRYCANRHAKSAAMAATHSASTHARRQLSAAATRARAAARAGLHRRRHRDDDDDDAPPPRPCCCCAADDDGACCPPAPALRPWLHCAALPLLIGRL
ncbi:hypothetical protein U9M48_038663 [Paspalum notatum var. saurae]|uniref:Uncharacterized protein n=1 Tax=Paspalum notatum var. saurae TaxID=547442 RepID=A0AAQ3UJ11_PASNO